jgi:hypothetical protein
LAPTVRPSKLVHAANLIEDRPTDPQACITLEGNAPIRLEPIDGIDQPDQTGRLKIVRAGDSASRNVHTAGDPGSQRRIALDERTSRRRVARATPCPKHG